MSIEIEHNGKTYIVDKKVHDMITDNKSKITMKHTPGPWTCESIHPDNGRIQIGSPKDYICEMYKGYDHPDITCTDGTLPGEQQTQQEQEANARLIAAAPDMLEALNRCVSCLEHMAKHPEYYSLQTEERSKERYEMVMSAIKKATE